MAATSQIPEKFNDYEGFVDKFKAKKTSDDCYTPDLVYDAVREWVFTEYAEELVDCGMPVPVIRPFWPGADYTVVEYPEKCVVIDNPPFSMYKKIVQFFADRNIKFFLFAPYLTCFSAANVPGVCLLPVDAKITYENGACINTAFITNLDGKNIVRSAPSLRRAVMEADERNQYGNKKHLPSYVFPHNILTATMVGKISRMGKNLNVKRSAAHYLTALESMKKARKKFFGGAFIISDKTARRTSQCMNESRDEAIEWQLSAAEKEIISELSAAEKEIISKLNEAEKTMAKYNMPTAKEFVSHFMKWLGYKEKKNADSRYLDYLYENAGKNNFTRWQPLAGAGNGDQWCGYCVDGVAVEVCGSIAAAEYLLCQPQKSYMSGYTPDMEQWYKDAGRYYLTPEVGDQVFYYIASKGRTGHTGTVASVNKEKKTFKAIEGNTSSAYYDDNGGCIATHEYSYAKAGKSGERVRGFGRPRFAAEKVEEPEMDYESFVKTAYKTVLNREPDTAGLATWVDAMKHGLPPEKVLTGLKESEEGEANARRIRESTTRLAYYMLLGRPGKDDEIKAWTSAAKDGALLPVEDIWRKIANSKEAKSE